MKLILTESQYKLLEAIIEEATKAFSTKIEKGGFIQVKYMLGDIEKSNIFEITDIYGTGKYVGAVSGSEQFIINIGGSLDTTDNSFTVLKDGQYKDEGNGPEIVGGVKQKRKNVTSINISDVGKNIVDTVKTDLGEEKDVGKKTTDEKLKKRREWEKNIEKKLDDNEREIFDMIMNNPRLKKAMYHQPKLLGGLINFGKAKGIGPAKSLLNKYIGGYDLVDKDNEKSFGEFKVNKGILYQIERRGIDISYGNIRFNLQVGGQYEARYEGKQYFRGKDKASGLPYKIYLKEKLDDDIYRGTIKVYFKDNNQTIDRMESIIIRIKDYIL